MKEGTEKIEERRATCGRYYLCSQQWIAIGITSKKVQKPGRKRKQKMKLNEMKVQESQKIEAMRDTNGKEMKR